MFERYKKIVSIKNKLRNNKLSLGSWMQIPNSTVGEILGDANYDWIAIDMEHSLFNFESLVEIFRSIELGNTLPIVRLSETSSYQCKQVLEIGAGGIIIPMVENAAQLEEISLSCKFLPKGKRGIGFNRSNLFGKYFNNYQKESKPIIIAQIETAEAIKNIDEILNVSSLDAIFIGPYDLTASMGITGEFNHPKFKKIMKNIVAKCKQKKIAPGIHVVEPNLKDLKEKINIGFRFIAYSIDTVILNQLSNISNKDLI